MEEEAKKGSSHPLLLLDGGLDYRSHGVKHLGTRPGVEVRRELRRRAAVVEEEEDEKRQRRK